MSIPPPGTPAYANPAPLPDLPEVPDGVTPSGTARWKPWTSIVALIAAFGATLAAAIFIGIVAVAAGAEFDDPPPAVNIIATVVQDLCLIGSAVLFARMSAGRVSPRQFGLRLPRFWSSLGWTILTYFVFIGFSAAWVALLNIKSEDDLPKELGVDDSTVALIAVAILVTVVAPIAEEFFFRGFYFTSLRNWKGIWPAAILTGLTFGAIHIGSAPVGYLVPLAVLGFLLCLLYVRTKSLYPCIGLHCLNNSIAFGVSQHWGGEIVLLLAGSLLTITLILGAVQLRFGRERALAAA